MCFCFLLFFSLICFISTSGCLFYFGKPTSMCNGWGEMHGLSLIVFQKIFIFLRDPESIYVACRTTRICRDNKSLRCLLLVFSLQSFLATPNSLSNPVLPVYSESSECLVLSLLQAFVHDIPSSQNSLPWAYSYTFFSLNVGSFGKLLMLLKQWSVFSYRVESLPLY